MEVVLPTPYYDIKLELMRLDTLLAPRAVFEKLQGETTSAEKVSERCFYHGRVTQSERSYAAVSLNGSVVVSTSVVQTSAFMSQYCISNLP